MKLTEEQSRELFQARGSYVKEVCDRCGAGIGPFNRRMVLAGVPRRSEGP